MLIPFPGYSIELSTFDSPVMEASLIVQNLETDLDYDDSIVKSRINRIAMILFEPSYPSFQPGLQFGAFEINQNNNPVTAGINVTGDFLGVVFRSLLLSSEHSGLLLEGNYAYYTADKTYGDQEVNFQWHEYQIQAALLLSYGNLDFSLGGYTHSINGDEADYGVITQTRNFDEQSNTGVHTGLEYWVDATGKVGAYADIGGGKQFPLIFTREY